MSLTRAKNPSSLAVFEFSYDEHDWNVDGEDELREALLRAAADNPWERLEKVGPDKAGDYCESGIESLDDLRKRVCATIVDEWNMPAEAVTIPLERMRERMREEGWTFVGGAFTEFEGHHNDSEIHVVVEKNG